MNDGLTEFSIFNTAIDFQNLIFMGFFIAGISMQAARK